MVSVIDLRIRYEESEFTSYKELAEASGVGAGTIRRVFKDLSGRDSTLLAIANALGFAGESLQSKFDKAREKNKYYVRTQKYVHQIIIDSEEGVLVYATYPLTNHTTLEKLNLKVEQLNEKTG